ncbi:MAG: hydrolase [Alphaproteobacteria bacterium]|nr:hydrolase [Alphaproteobacteria bacterium]
MTDQIPPHLLPNALDFAPQGVRMLSLDCFDTLLWRHVHAPRHVFADLGGGFSLQQRAWAESQARSAATLRRGCNEVGIADIYRELMPKASDEARKAAADAELAAEARHCYGFAPTVALMREAKARGLEVAIVSDTYLDSDQLAELIRAGAGAEVFALIDRIFCSSQFGVSKGEGLFRHVLRETRIKPTEILHIGDNRHADLVAANACGINALHLAQFDEASEQRLRLEASIAAILENAQLAYQPHRAAIASGWRQLEDPAERLGFGVLGPVMTAFAHWIDEEARTLGEGRDGKVHVLFLMRDGYLPQKIFQALFPDTTCGALEISRFAAIASALTEDEAILRHLDRELAGDDLKSIARQFLFPAGEAAALLARLPRKARGAAFASAIRARPVLRSIVQRSRGFADRLCAYVEREVEPERGDTLLLVDLGYNGTVQNHLAPLLEARFGVAVAGRYLILREQDVSGCDKKGLIDARAYDSFTLEALCGNVAVLEQLCTAAVGSVVGYGADGGPIRADSSIKGRQSDIRDKVQAGCLRYALDHLASVVRPPRSDCEATRRQAAMAVLARLMFLPLPDELEVVSSFDHDVNLGGGATVPLFDPDVAETGLRRRGLFYLKGAERMYLPAELRGRGLPLSLSFLALRRFALDLRYADFCDNGIDLPILFTDGSEVATDSVRALPTQDGYFVAAIPIGDCRYAIGVQFGQLYDWVQVDSVEFLPVQDFLSEGAGKTKPPFEALPSLEGMEQVAPHLLRCETREAFMMVPPPQREDDTRMMLAVAFRPIAARTPAETRAPEAERVGEAVS